MDRRNKQKYIEAGLIALLVVIISVAHYVTPASKPLLHDVYRRLYYVPIVWAATSFGLPGGLTVSVLVSMIFLPHILSQWGKIPLMATDALFEILLYNAIAAVTGVLSNLESESRSQLTKANIALLRTSQLKELGEIAAGMAHEIRNPLASLRGGIELLGKETATAEDRAEVSGILLPEVERIERAIRNFLIYARPEQLSIQNIDVGEVAGEVYALLERGGYDNVAFGLDIEKNLPPVQADLTQIRSIIMNLALNAVGAIDGTGKVDIHVAKSGNDVILRVKDTGRGLDPSVGNRIFEPFFTTRKDGLGLGLSIVKRIIEDHGGSIKYDSRPGVGTTFEVRLRGGVQ